MFKFILKGLSTVYRPHIPMYTNHSNIFPASNILKVLFSLKELSEQKIQASHSVRKGFKSYAT